MAQVNLYFYDAGTTDLAPSPAPCLERAEFSHPLIQSPRVSLRGRALSDPASTLTFLWSPAVRAACILLLRTRADDPEHFVWPSRPLVAIRGGAGSVAASLDYAISRKPLWLLDMFGANSGGQAIAQNLFMRWNPERKRGGEVVIAVNPTQLCREAITVFLNAAPLSEIACASLADSIEKSNKLEAANRNENDNSGKQNLKAGSANNATASPLLDAA